MVRKALILATVLGVVATTIAAVPQIAAAGPPVLSYTPNAAWWGTNGRVMDILPMGGRVYLAGGFDYVGPSTGYGVALSDESGQRSATAPRIDGPVYAAVADGAGGWYVAGAFTSVGGQFRRGAARIAADGSVTQWNPKPLGTVYTLAVSGDKVVMGGDLTEVGTTPVAANRLGAVDLVKGLPAPGWTASANGTVRSLVASGTAVYAGGAFGVVNGASRGGLVRLSAANGSTDNTFTGRTTGGVNTLSLSPAGDTLYVGGDLTSAYNGVGFSPRTRLAAYGTATSTLLAWAPAADATVTALATDPLAGTVYAGGLFTTIAGQPRSRLAGINSAGAATTFSPGLNGCNTRHVTKYAHSNPPCSTEVSALTVADGKLYVGGRFNQSGAISRHDAAAFSLADGTLAPWNPVFGDRVTALAPSGTGVFAGGDFTSVGGQVRKGIAALDAATGSLDPTFSADTDNEVLDLVGSSDGSRLYLAGSFGYVQGQPRSKLASILTATGTVDTAFKPAFNNEVLSIGLAGGALFAGGQFSKVNGLARSHAVKLSPTTGAVDPVWKADTIGPSGPLLAQGMVESLAVAPDGSKVFLGGPFSAVNNTVRPGGIAVVNGTTGALTAQQLGGVQGCSGIGPWINHLYLSPDGQRLYGGDVCPDNIYQWDAVRLSSPANTTGLNWRTLCNAGMQGALEVNGSFYYGTHGGDRGNGGFCLKSPTGTTRVSQQRYFVFDAASAVLQPDAPTFDTPMGVWSFAAVPQGLLVGGDFTYAGGSANVQQGLALFPGTP